MGDAMKDIKIVFMGTPDFAVPVLQSLISNHFHVELVVTQPDKKVGRKQILTYTPVKQVALEENIEIFQPEKIKVDYKKIEDINPDLIITCAYGQILPEEILNLPHLGCINVHASLLPKYRGGAPIHWAKMNGEEKTGITIMYMDKAMDTGDIIAQKELVIKKEDTTEDLFKSLSVLGAEVLIKTLPSIINKTNKRIKQDPKLATYAYNIKREDERISFEETGEKIINKVRGLYSFPLANFILENTEYKVVEAFFEEKQIKETGYICVLDKNHFGISCKDGIIYITKIKPFGKKTMEIKDFLNGIDKKKYEGKKVNV